MSIRFRHFTFALLLIAGFSVLSLEADMQVVLVTSDATKTDQFSTRELRKLFLGIPVKKDGHKIQPLINRSSSQLYQLFLQKVLRISESNYERQLISRVFRIGGTRPQSYSNENQLIHALNEEPGRVTYLSIAKAQQLSDDVRIVQTLW